MRNTPSCFSISAFRYRIVVWIILAVFILAFVPSANLAQQPTATIKTLSGDVLVSGQVATAGTVLQAGDTIQTQAGASAVLKLSDGSEIQLGENTQITIADLAQTATGARVSSIKLLAGWLRALLSPGYQQEGASFTIETPNAQLGVKFSQPDVEVHYDPEKQETIGIAHTVELLAKNILTGESVVVPIGSSVIITAVGIKIIAGIVGIVGASSAGSTGTGTAGAGTASGGASGISTGTITIVGVTAATAGGVVALTKNIEERCNSAECTGDLSGIWDVDGSCIAQGCTEDIPCPLTRPECCGTKVCDCCEPCWFGPVTQTGNLLSGSLDPYVTPPYAIPFLNGSVDSNSVSFTIEQDGIVPLLNATTQYTGTLDGSTIRGTFSGFTYDPWVGGNVTWSGTFTVTIQ